MLCYSDDSSVMFEFTHDCIEAIVIVGEVKCNTSRLHYTAPCILPKLVKSISAVSKTTKLLVITTNSSPSDTHEEYDEQSIYSETESLTDKLTAAVKAVASSTVKKSYSLVVHLVQNLPDYTAYCLESLRKCFRNFPPQLCNNRVGDEESESNSKTDVRVDVDASSTMSQGLTSGAISNNKLPDEGAMPTVMDTSFTVSSDSDKTNYTPPTIKLPPIAPANST